MNPILSIQSRYHTWLQQHFELGKAGRQLKKLRNKYKGKRCFIVANGPSLQIDDLEKLANANEFTFGMNRIYKIFNETSWRPTFYACEDELIAKEQQKEINDIPSKIKFIPIELKWFHDIDIKDAQYFHLNYREEKRSEYGISSNIAHQIDCRGTVTCTCMQIAMYMGFTEIYLLGVDHNYRKIIDINGNVIEDSSAKDYFCEGYDTDIKDVVVHDMGKNTLAYLDAKKFVEKTGKSVIYNATRGGKLEVFQRVDFDSLFT